MREQEAERDERDDGARAAVADQRQRQSLRRQQARVDADVDERLEARA